MAPRDYSYCTVLVVFDLYLHNKSRIIWKSEKLSVVANPVIAVWLLWPTDFNWSERWNQSIRAHIVSRQVIGSYRLQVKLFNRSEGSHILAVIFFLVCQIWDATNGQCTRYGRKDIENEWHYSLMTRYSYVHSCNYCWLYTTSRSSRITWIGGAETSRDWINTDHYEAFIVVSELFKVLSKA